MDLLKKAREYVASNTIDSSKKCAVHLTPETGWLNDPNGFSYFNGKYHMFYQFFPYAPRWNRMHWGHATSNDCIKWDYAPVALAPVYPLKIGKACYSGSAIEHDGKHYLIFTQNGIGQRQCLAYSDDGVDYKRVMKPVIAEKELPRDVSIGNFRDPKVWKKGDRFYVLVGGQQKSNVKFGNILLFSSDDLYKWTYVGKLFDESFCIKTFEDMAECPDFFNIDGKDVIIVSPWRKQKVVYMVGALNYETGKFSQNGETELLDYGTDFFATQSTTTASGEVMLSAWAQATVSSENPMVKDGWNGLLTLPRKVELKGNKLYQMPISALKNYRKGCEKLQGEIVGNKEMLTRGEVLDIELNFPRVKDGDGIVLFADSEGNGLKVYYENGCVKIDRTLNYRASAKANEYILSALVDTNNGALSLRIVLDKFLIEVFANDGQRAFSTIVTPTPDRTKVILTTASNTECEVELYSLQ